MKQSRPDVLKLNGIATLQKDPKLAQAYFRLGVIHASPVYNRKLAQEYLFEALKLGLDERQSQQAKEILQRL